MMLNPAPEAKSLNLSTWFNSSDKRCPAERFVISTNNTIENKLNDTEATNFEIKETDLLLLPTTPGNFTFWVFGESRSGERGYVQVDVVNFPCDASVAEISPKSDKLLDVTPFYSKSTKGKVEYLVGMKTINDTEFENRKYTIPVPKFNNNDDLLCPLTHNLSSSGEKFVDYKTDATDKADATVVEATKGR
jgi:hypothetical protein